MIKRSECRCLCHSDANTLGMIDVPMHVMPCCYDDIGEQKMSVETLHLQDEDLKVKVIVENEWYCFYCSDKEWLHSFRLDRNQAHLLYLYLKERFEGK